MIFFPEINYDQHVGDQDGNESGERRAGHAEPRPRADPKNQQGREDDIKDNAEDV